MSLQTVIQRSFYLNIDPDDTRVARVLDGKYNNRRKNLGWIMFFYSNQYALYEIL